jgi:hypothetical protein
LLHTLNRCPQTHEKKVLTLNNDHEQPKLWIINTLGHAVTSQATSIAAMPLYIAIYLKYEISPSTFGSDLVSISQTDKVQYLILPTNTTLVW